MAIKGIISFLLFFLLSFTPSFFPCRTALAFTFYQPRLVKSWFDSLSRFGIRIGRPFANLRSLENFVVVVVPGDPSHLGRRPLIPGDLSYLGTPHTWKPLVLKDSLYLGTHHTWRPLIQGDLHT